jgi:hypothetical protein
MLGQKMETLINKPIDKGIYTIQLMQPNMTFETGSYILRMQTENFTQSQIFQVHK